MKSKWLLLAGLLWSGHALAQGAAENCPELPSGAELTWDVVNGPDFLFCRAIRIDDGSQAFSVRLGRDCGCRAERSRREEGGRTAGQKGGGARGEGAAGGGVRVRGPGGGLGRRHTAHSVVRAGSEAR